MSVNIVAKRYIASRRVHGVLSPEERVSILNESLKEAYYDGQEWLTRHIGESVKLCQLLSSGEYSFLRYDIPIKKQGVYFLLKLRSHNVREIIYIGESENILQRIGCHSGNMEFDYCGWFHVPGGREARRAVERAMIKKHNPRLNVRGLSKHKNTT